MQNARIGREREDSGFLTGKPKNNITFHPDHRPVMLNTLKNVEKPILEQTEIFKEFEKDESLKNASFQEKFDAITKDYGTYINSFFD